MVSARAAAVVNPASAQPLSLPDSAIPTPTVADGQTQIANSFNDAPKVTASSVAAASAPAAVPPKPSKGGATSKGMSSPRAAASMNVQVGTDANFVAEFLNSNKPIMVTFGATWCGPCKGLAPIVDQVTDRNLGRLIVVKVDIDDSPALAEQYRVRGVPTILIFNGGRVVEKYVGLTTAAKLEGLFAKYV